jgi:hypothetical protein
MPFYNSRFTWNKYPSAFYQNGNIHYYCCVCGTELRESERMLSICGSCSGMRCANCGSPFKAHKDWICPNEASAKKRDAVKDGILDWFLKLTPSAIAGYLQAFRGYSTSDVLKLGGYYTAFFGYAMAQMNGRGGIADMRGIEALIPKTAAEVPSFYQLPQWAQWLVAYDRQQHGAAAAAGLAQAVLNDRSHVVWNTDQWLEQNRPAVTLTQFSNGLDWSGAWIPGVRDGKGRGVSLSEKPFAAKFKTATITTLSPGQYMSYKFKAQPTGRGDDSKIAVFVGNGTGWVMFYPTDKSAPATMSAVAGGKIQTSEPVTALRRGWNEIHLRYDRQGMMNLRLNDQDFSGALFTDGSPQQVDAGVVGVSAVFGDG